MKLAKFEFPGRAPMTKEAFIKAVKDAVNDVLYEDHDIYCYQGEDYPECDGEEYCDEYDSCQPFKVVIEIHDAS